MNKEDIEVISIGINDTFRYAGKVFHGLEDLKKSAFEDYNKKEKMSNPPYVVIIEHLYPCFDSEDYANENRYYQNYYFTTDRKKAERICEETVTGYTFTGKPQLYPILEPAFSMGKIEEHHLPYIYYHGEGSLMQIVQNKNADPKDKITIVRPSSGSGFGSRSLFDPDPEPIACLYGPPPEWKEEPPALDDEEEDTHNRSWLNILLGKK